MTGVAVAAALASLCISVFTLLLAIGMARRMRNGARASNLTGTHGGSFMLPATDQPVPEFRFFDADGVAVDRSRLSSGRHALAFVSSSCDACVDSLPGFVELARMLGPQRSLAVLLDDGEDRGLAVTLMQRLRAASTLVVENGERDVSKLFDVVSFPTFVGVEDGVVRLASHRVTELAQWYSK